MMAGREKIWVVRAGDGKTAGEIVRRMGEQPERAVEEGRVFIGKKRAARVDHPVRTGDTVRLGPKTEGVGTPPPAIEILFERDGLVACAKPAGLPTVPDHVGASHALVALVAKAIGATVGELRVTSRLDRDVSGVVVFALDGRAEERLRAARSGGRYQRRYVALTSRPLDASEGVWSAPIGRAPRPELRRARGPEAKEALTRWAMVAMATPSASSAYAMLAVDPVTGRTHQIRVHASDAGAPLIGDHDYGGARRITLANGRVLAPARIALHAARVVVPGARGPLEAIATIPEELQGLWAGLGGAPEAWNRALSCETPPPPDP